MILGIYPAVTPRLQQKNSLPYSKSVNKPVVFGAKTKGIGEIFGKLLPETLTKLSLIREKIYKDPTLCLSEYSLFQILRRNANTSPILSTSGSNEEELIGKNFSKINIKNAIAGFARSKRPLEYAVYNEEGIFKIIPKDMTIMLVKSKKTIQPNNYNKRVQEILNTLENCLQK